MLANALYCVIMDTSEGDQMAYSDSIRFDSISKGTEFRLPFSSLTFVKKSATSAKVYNDYDEYIGIERFRSSDQVEPI